MLKKITKVLCLCMAMLLSLGTLSVWAAEQPIYVYWDFTQSSYSGLNPKNNGGNVASGDGILNFIKTGSGNLEAGVNLLNAASGKLANRVVMEMEVLATADTFLIYCQNSPLSGSLIRLQRYSDDTIRLQYGKGAGNATETVAFPNGEWNKLKIILNLTEHTAYVYVNGEPCTGGEVSFMSSTAGYTETLNQIIIQHTGAADTDLKIRNFAVYKDTDVSAAQVSYDAIQVNTEITEDRIELPTEVAGGSQVAWSSSDSSLIDPQTGQVRFPSFAEGEKNVTLTAAVTHGTVTLNKTFSVNLTAKMTDDERVQADAEDIELPDTVYDTISLPAKGKSGSAITWTASPAEAFQIPEEPNGDMLEVTTKRTEQDINATLSATVSYGTAQTVKTFSVLLRRIVTDAVSVAEDLDNIQLPAVMTDGFELPLTGGNGSDITWASDAEKRLTIQNGKVQLLTAWPEDTEVTLTATATKNGAVKTKVFTVLLEKDIETSAVLLQEAVDKLQISPTSGVVSDLTLPTAGENDTVISWTSANPSVISADGRVNRTSKDTVVTLTASLARGSQTKEKAFRITVKGTSGSSGSFSGGGSSGGRYSGTSTAVNITKDPNASQQRELPPPPTAEPETRNRFADVSPEHWAWEYIEDLADKEMVQGSDGNFEPERAVTREEFVKMTVAAMQVELDETETLTFADTEPNAWYAPYVETALAREWIQGISAERFGIGEVITREQAAVILWRILNLNENGELSFRDSDSISAYAAEAAAGLASAGILSGNENNEFCPAASLTRAEAAKLVCKLTEFAGEGNHEE